MCCCWAQPCSQSIWTSFCGLTSCPALGFVSPLWTWSGGPWPVWLTLLSPDLTIPCTSGLPVMRQVQNLIWWSRLLADTDYYGWTHWWQGSSHTSCVIIPALMEQLILAAPWQLAQMFSTPKLSAARPSPWLYGILSTWFWLISLTLSFGLPIMLAFAKPKAPEQILLPETWPSGSLLPLGPLHRRSLSLSQVSVHEVAYRQTKQLSHTTFFPNPDLCEMWGCTLLTRRSSCLCPKDTNSPDQSLPSAQGLYSCKSCVVAVPASNSATATPLLPIWALDHTFTPHLCGEHQAVSDPGYHHQVWSSLWPWTCLITMGMPGDNQAMPDPD